MELKSPRVQGYHSAVSISSDPRKGRKLVANERIPAGSDVLIERPLSFSLQFDEWPLRCHWCFRSSSNLIVCGGCDVARYCTAACQQQAAASHEHECAALGSGTRPESDVDRTLAGLMRSIYDSPEDDEFDKLFSGKFDSMTRSDFRKQLPTILKLAGSAASRMSPDYCIDVCCRYLINSFLIMTDSMTRIGMGFYLKAALLNHSCCPNCWTKFDGSTVRIRTLCDIAPGDELTISYIELNQSRAERQKDLGGNYFFDCDCDRCERELVTESAAVIVSPKARMSMLSLKQQVFAARDEGNWRRCKALALDLLEEQQDSLETHDPEITETLNILISTCEQLKHMNGAKQHCLAKLEISRACYPKVHPEIAFQLLQLGKIELINQDTADAIGHFKECLGMLQTTHGDGDLINTVSQYIAIATLKAGK
eukprot:TRINITY_DN3594_c0_g1_i2.p1 TRINITY_DN3594_c0_g1~~TRINITY_DN3594_c0_g1_i2.p1  ORF type:complete len:425 (+),score=96.00 TRINITY_DN3594_c0_g1_i2:59-1333(+)